MNEIFNSLKELLEVICIKIQECADHSNESRSRIIELEKKVNYLEKKLDSLVS